MALLLVGRGAIVVAATVSKEAHKKSGWIIARSLRALKSDGLVLGLRSQRAGSKMTMTL